MIVIVNLHTYRHRARPGVELTYVGRRAGSWTGSPLANPFPLVAEAAREECFAKYEAWLHEQSAASEAGRELRRLAKIAATGSLLLACWCAPALCHADAIRREIERLNSPFCRAWEAADEEGRYALDERAAILEFEAGLERGEAERRAVEAIGRTSRRERTKQ